MALVSRRAIAIAILIWIGYASAGWAAFPANSPAFSLAAGSATATANEEAHPSPADAAAKEKRRHRRIRNASLAAIALALAAFGTFSYYKRISRRYAAKGKELSIGVLARALVGHAKEAALRVSTPLRAIAVMFSTSAIARTRQAALGGSLLLVGGGALLFNWGRTLDIATTQVSGSWRIAFLGLGVLLSGAVILMLRAGLLGSGLAQDQPLRAVAPNFPATGTLRMILVGAGSLVWVGLFQWMDVWNAHFDLHTWHYYAYTPLRLLFMPLLAMALIGTGRVVFSAIQRRWGALEIGPIETLLAAFFVGGSAWYLVMFLLGLLGSINRYVVVPAFVISIPLSIPLASNALHGLREGVRNRIATMSTLDMLLVCVPFSALGVLWLHVLVNRGLSVTGFEYDSSGHYLPYYQAVLESGGTGVNELWYHFWMTKGAGLQFVAVMLTDLQGPQLVSFTFLTMAIAVLAVAVRQMSGSVSLALGACVLFIAPFVHGFPSYQKLHIVTLGMMGGILWLLTLAWQQRRLLRGTWLASITLMACAATLHTTPMAAILVPFLAATYGLFAICTKRGERGEHHRWIWAMPASVVLVTVLGILALNYVLTGVMELTPFRLFWRLADQTRFSELVSPYLMLLLDEGTSAATGNAFLSGLDVRRLYDLMQLSYMPAGLRYLSGLLMLALATVFCFSTKARSIVYQSGALPVLILLATAALISLAVRQPGSIDRFYVFVLFPLVLILVVLPAVALDHFANRFGESSFKAAFTRSTYALAIVFVSITSAGVWTSSYFYWNSPEILKAKVTFELGLNSFRDSLLKPQISPRPEVWPRQEISEPCLTARDRVLVTLPPNTKGAHREKIWTMTFLQEAGCHIMPGVNFMMEISNRFGTHWHRIVLGDSAVAVAELKKLGIQYLFIDLGDRDEEHKTGESTSIFGCLPFSPLLASESVQEHFSVTRVKDEAYLLTLIEKDTKRTPTPPDFTYRFTRKLSAQPIGTGDMRAICHRLQDYYKHWGENWPVHSDPNLPKLKGWQ